MKTMLDWKLSHGQTADSVGEEWIKATVPGCVQLDMAAAHSIPLYYTGDHEDEFTWMENEFWLYKTEADIIDGDTDPFLIFKGVEYRYDVFVNGDIVLSHEGMFTESRIDMSPYRGKRVVIEVLIYPAPKVEGAYIERGLGNEAAHSCKPAFSYGWDWCPRFVSLGIIDEAYIEYRPKARLDNVKVSYCMNADLSSASVTFEYAETAAESVEYTLFDPNGVAVVCETCSTKETKHTFNFANPELWWPHNHGNQPVYEFRISAVKDGEITDTYSRKIGFKRVKLVENAGTWDEQETAEKRTTPYPMTVEINGRRIFIKGSNWVPPEMCRAQLKKDAVKRLLVLLREVNMNALRMWGGGYIHPDFFYEMCDELGILVWQEFPLACACYSEEKDYLDVLKQESTAIIEGLRTHPCIMLWCGGNELFNDWSKMTMQSKALRLLETQTFLLDGDVPYLYTSPQHGVIHGPYDMVDINGIEGLTTVYDNDATAFTEFGCGCPSEWSYLETFMSKEALAEPFTHPMWRKRHATCDLKPVIRYIDVRGIKMLTGCSDDPKELVSNANKIQSIMYKCMFEAVRHKWPRSSMSINWCYNEPWPTAGGNGIVNYPDLRRPSYFTVQKALCDTKLSLGFSRIAWHPGEEFDCTVWLLNDSADVIKSGKAVLSVIADGVENEIAVWNYGETASRTNNKGISVRIKVPDIKNGKFTLAVRSDNNPDLNDEYELFISETAV